MTTHNSNHNSTHSSRRNSARTPPKDPYRHAGNDHTVSGGPAPAGSEPLFLTVEEVARELRCTPRHVRNLISRGDLPRVELGRAVRVPRSALIALADTATTVGGE